MKPVRSTENSGSKLELVLFLKNFLKINTLDQSQFDAVPLIAFYCVCVRSGVNPGPELRLSREEIFGPILPVVSYASLDTVIETINGKEKPLALYIHGNNRSEIDGILEQTSSGGVTVNDFLMHAGSHSMGFGGVGESGMGRYKGGKIGFQAFSNPKSVFEQGIMRKFSQNFIPPLSGSRVHKMLRSRIGLK